MTLDEKLQLVENMQNYGGGFVQALALCFLRADEANLAKLLKAFPDYVQQYKYWGNE